VTAVQAVLLILVGATGSLVALARDPLRQALLSGIFGVALALLFFAMQAPDVALSQIAVGGVAIPAMVLMALAEVRAREEDRDE
jgi:energy-converting hydrogenase B subunit D